MDRKAQMMADEEERHVEFASLIEGLTPEQMLEPTPRMPRMSALPMSCPRSVPT